MARTFIALTVILQSLFTPRAAESQDIASERAILMELFKATDGDNWKRKDGWGSDKPVCEWDGVWCGFDGTSVRELRLWDNNMRGVMPAAVVQLRVAPKRATNRL